MPRRKLPTLQLSNPSSPSQQSRCTNPCPDRSLIPNTFPSSTVTPPHPLAAGTDVGPSNSHPHQTKMIVSKSKQKHADNQRTIGVKSKKRQSSRLNFFEQHCFEHDVGSSSSTSAIHTHAALEPNDPPPSSSNSSTCKRMRLPVQPLYHPTINTLQTFDVEPNRHRSNGQAVFQCERGVVVTQYFDSDSNDYSCSHCGALFWLNEAKKYPATRDVLVYTGCCQQGQVKLPSSRRTPLYLATLLDPTNGPESKLFRENVRVYNAMFCFSSMGAKIDYGINSGVGPYVFKICGQIHHLMGSVFPAETDSPKYAQIYVYDTENEIANRIHAIDPNSNNRSLRPDIVSGLIQMFNEFNKLTKKFRSVRDKFADPTLPYFRMTLLDHQVGDTKQFDRPTCDEIAGLIVGDIGDPNTDRDIVICSVNSVLHRVSRIHPKYMALQYPILFPYGEDGYHTDLQLHVDSFRKPKTRTRMPMRSFIAYQIQDRVSDEGPLLKGGRLFQQYLVDAYATLEQNRLDYIRFNSEKFRRDKYRNLSVAVSDGVTDSREIGTKFILPGSHTGSPRDMLNNYQDAMAICREYGNPDLFITFTCNVKWPEITKFFDSHQGFRPEDRPDIVTRIFHIKLEDMIDYIKSGQPFGPIYAHVHTVEFQKRGLPHAHMLFWLIKSNKCYNSKDVDSIISAELPDKHSNMKLYEYVSSYMIHGPCGPLNFKSPCMVDGSCTKSFPKPFIADTIFDTIKSPTYRRRDDENRFCLKDDVHVGNNFVVPYNAELLLRYQAHINVESCSQSMLIKYLFKYLNKGPDRACILLDRDPDDEIKNYLNCRYITPHESVWRLFDYSIHSHFPAVYKLDIHLPDEQNVMLKESDQPASVLKYKSMKDTTLTAWFKANQKYEFGRDLTYVQYPTKFVWNSKYSEWTPRKQYRTIGRVTYVHPMAGELYYMRMLLNLQKGCTSFSGLRTFNNKVYNTYQEACLAQGLLGDDKEWAEALSYSTTTASSHEIRQLFVTLLLFCEVADPITLFNTFWISMCDDIIYKAKTSFNLQHLTIPTEEVRNILLFELEKLLVASSSSLQKFSLPMPDATKLLELKNHLVTEELNNDFQLLKQQHDLCVNQLNEGQKLIYNAVIQSILEAKPELFFVHGSGGTGKTFLWHTIIAKLRSEGKIVLAVASSGVASLLLPKRKTAHSRFKIPLVLDDSTIFPIKKTDDLAILIRRTALIVWDEAPMSNKYCFESLDRSLRDILSDSNNGSIDIPFGGKPILLGGDFRQTLPIITGGSKEQIVNASLKCSYLWPLFTIYKLTENMRLARAGLSTEENLEIAAFATWLLAIGEGRLPFVYKSHDPDTSFIEIPLEFLLINYDDPIEAIFNATYPDFTTKFNNADYLRERAIITPKNLTVHVINEYAINVLPGDKHTYLSYDTISPVSGLDQNISLLYPPEFLNKLEFSGLPKHELVLKLGMPVMLLRNIDQINGLCNGTRMIITSLFHKLLEVKILTGTNVGTKVFIPRITLISPESKWPFVLRRRQFPIRPCYAMTINKSQGQSLNQVGLYLSQPVFTHGQLYVALSRVTEKKNLKIIIEETNTASNHCTKNVVYKDVLQGL